MASANLVIVIGNLTRDVELQFTPGGFAIGKTGIAINRKYKDSKTNELREEVTFVELKFLGKTAETAQKYLHKGSPLYVRGRLSFDSWEDKQTGQKRSKLYVTVDEMQFLERRPEGQSQGQSQARPAQAQSRPLPARPPEAQAEPEQAQDPFDDLEEESVPF